MPQGVNIRFTESGQLEIPLQWLSAVAAGFGLSGRDPVRLAVIFDFCQSLREMGRDLLPLMLLEHRHVSLAAPAIECFGH